MEAAQPGGEKLAGQLVAAWGAEREDLLLERGIVTAQRDAWIQRARQLEAELAKAGAVVEAAHRVVEHWKTGRLDQDYLKRAKPQLISAVDALGAAGEQTAGGRASDADLVIAEMVERLDWIAAQATFHLDPDANEGAPLTDNEDTNRALQRFAERVNENAEIIEWPEVLAAYRRVHGEKTPAASRAQAGEEVAG